MAPKSALTWSDVPISLVEFENYIIGYLADHSIEVISMVDGKSVQKINWHSQKHKESTHVGSPSAANKKLAIKFNKKGGNKDEEPIDPVFNCGLFRMVISLLLFFILGFFICVFLLQN